MLGSLLKKFEKPVLAHLDEKMVRGIQELAQVVCEDAQALNLGEITAHLQTILGSDSNHYQLLAANILFDELFYPKEFLQDGMRARSSVREQLGQKEMTIKLYPADYQDSNLSVHAFARNGRTKQDRSLFEQLNDKLTKENDILRSENQVLILHDSLLRVNKNAFKAYNTASASYPPNHLERYSELKAKLDDTDSPSLDMETKKKILEQMNTLFNRNMLPIEAVEIFDNGIPTILEELTSNVRKFNTTTKLDWNPLPLVLEAVDEARIKLQKAVTDWEKPEDFVGIQSYLDRIGHPHQ